METDFYDAHRRHWEDAEYLLEHDRKANADHLYGISAECGLKNLMLSLGMKMTNGRPEGYAFHIDKLWDKYRSFLEGKIYGAGYDLGSEDYFNDWKVEHRYAHRSEFSLDTVERHRQGARVVKRLMDLAEQRGNLP